MWPVRCTKSLAVIESLANQWGVGSITLPEAHLSWADNNAWDFAPKNEVLSDINPQPAPQISSVHAQVLSETDLDLLMGD